MRPRPAWPWVVLGVLVAVSAFVRWLGARGVPSPWFTPDEQTYGLIGEGLWRHGRYEILGHEPQFLSLVYPLLAGLPLIDGAEHAVERLAARWPLGLASSSNRELIDLVLELAGLARFFRVTVSSEEVPRGKPAPDVYLEAARALRVPPERCTAVEDSQNGIRAAKAAGMRVIAIPNPHFPPGQESLALADVTLGSLAELTPSVVA